MPNGFFKANFVGGACIQPHHCRNRVLFVIPQQIHDSARTPVRPSLFARQFFKQEQICWSKAFYGADCISSWPPDASKSCQLYLLAPFPNCTPSAPAIFGGTRQHGRTRPSNTFSARFRGGGVFRITNFRTTRALKASMHLQDNLWVNES